LQFHTVAEDGSLQQQCGEEVTGWVAGAWMMLTPFRRLEAAMRAVSEGSGANSQRYLVQSLQAPDEVHAKAGWLGGNITILISGKDPKSLSELQSL
jgi:hypothetical protein